MTIVHLVMNACLGTNTSLKQKMHANITELMRQKPGVLTSVFACSVDMQKVVMLPRLPGVKCAVFTKRIVVFNETFAALGGVAEKRIKKRKNTKSTKKNAVNNNKHTPRKKKEKNHGK